MWSVAVEFLLKWSQVCKKRGCSKVGASREAPVIRQNPESLGHRVEWSFVMVWCEPRERVNN